MDESLLAEDLNSSIVSYQNKVLNPVHKSVEVLSLSTSISTEGLFETIKRKFNSFMEGLVVKVNKFVGLFTKLSEQEKHHLEMIKQGKESSKVVTLPVSREAISGCLKFIVAALSWISVGALGKYLGPDYYRKFKEDRHALVEKTRFTNEANRLQKMLHRHEIQGTEEEISQYKIGIFNNMIKVGRNFNERIRNVKWDKIEQAEKYYRNKAEETQTISKGEHVAKTAGRSGIMAVLFTSWVGLTAYLGSKILGLFKKIASLFTRGNNNNESEDSYSY